MAGTTWFTFSPATLIKSSEVNLNFDWLEGNLVPQTGGSATNGVYDLGASATKWRDLYLSNAFILGTTTMTSSDIGKVDASTIEVSGGTMRVKDSGISTAKIAASAVTSNTITAAGSAGGVGASTVASVAITVSANNSPVLISFGATINVSTVFFTLTTSYVLDMDLRLYRKNPDNSYTNLGGGNREIVVNTVGGSGGSYSFPAGINLVDNSASAGSILYVADVLANTGVLGAATGQHSLIAIELKR